MGTIGASGEVDPVKKYETVVSSGQSALRALLTMNGGATVAFLAFIGHIMEVGSMPVESGRLFVGAMQLFIFGTFSAVLAYGTIFFTNCLSRVEWRRLGNWMFGISILCGSASLTFFLIASLQAINGFRAANRISRAGPNESIVFLLRPWFLVAVILVGIAAFVVFLLRGKRPQREPQPAGSSSHGPQQVILSSPRVENLRDTLTALTSIGLDISDPARAAPTEVDLIRSVGLRLGPDDFASDVQPFVSASGGLLTKVDQVILQVALRNLALSTSGILPLLNSQLDPEKGQLFCVGENDNQVVFLTPSQVQALSARGWQFQASPTTYGTSPTLLP